jgi:hypothetical protein
VVNLVSSLVEQLTKVVDPVPSSVSPTLHLKSEPKVVAMITSSIDPTPPLKSAKVVDLVLSSVDTTPPLRSDKVSSSVTSSINPTPPLKSVKVVDLVPQSVNPTPPLKSATKVVDSVLPLVDPTPHSKSEDVTQVYLVNIDSLKQGVTLSIPMEPPSSNHMISIEWNHFTEPHIPSYMHFQITVQVCNRSIPNTVIDEGSYVIILFTNAWQDFGSP